MKYYVTGATGFIGGRVARQLIEAGHEVIAPVRTPAKAKDLADLGVTVVQEPYQPGGAPEMWLATFEDPDGNYFQLASPMPAH